MYLIANWKENKSVQEAKSWVEQFSLIFKAEKPNIEVIIAPSFILIPEVFTQIKESNLKVKLAAQYISKFESGSHTGEVSAGQVKEFADYVILSHSEREAMGETIQDAVEEIKLSIKYGLKPIYCLSGSVEYQILKQNLSIEELNQLNFAYEPIFAIGTGKPATAADVQKFKEESGLESFIYGGSVDAESVKEFLNLDYINGFLVGSASLNAENFHNIYKNL